MKTALRVRELLGERGIGMAVVNLLTIKPLDVRGIERALRAARYAVTLENGAASGGAGEYILASISPALRSRVLFCAGFPDCFVAHGTGSQLCKEHGLDAESLAKRILALAK